MFKKMVKKNTRRNSNVKYLFLRAAGAVLVFLFAAFVK